MLYFAAGFIAAVVLMECAAAWRVWLARTDRLTDPEPLPHEDLDEWSGDLWWR